MSGPTRKRVETVPVIRGWRTYPDGTHSPIERWVRHADGDWVSLDSSRRTSGDILMALCTCGWDKVHGPVCPDCGGSTEPGAADERPLIAAEALETAADECWHGQGDFVGRWLRDRAAALRKPTP